MALEELGPAERVAAGAIGRPGRRRFYLEVTAGGVTYSLLCEKEQMAALATQGLAALEEAGIDTDETAVSQILQSGLAVSDPVQPRLRVGSIALGIAASELITVTVESVDGDDGVSFVVAPEQFRAMALAALQAVAGGRPICPRCRLPIDPDGHDCPAGNGHRHL